MQFLPPDGYVLHSTVASELFSDNQNFTEVSDKSSNFLITLFYHFRTLLRKNIFNHILRYRNLILSIYNESWV